MEGIFKRRRKSILFFSALSLMALSLFFSTYHGQWDSVMQSRMEEIYNVYGIKTPKEEPLPAIHGGIVTLTAEQPVRVGKNKLIYFGLDKHAILMAVYVLELDPEFAYHYRIPIKEAQKGVRLGGQNFVLLSHGKNRIQLALTD